MTAAIAGFVTVPDGPTVRLRNATVPAPLLTALPPGARVSPDGLVVVDLTLRDGRIADVAAAGSSEVGGAGAAVGVDLQRGQVWPCLIDAHTHLDKGHTWERAPNPDGTFEGAIRTVMADRAAHWSAEDVRRRMEFGLHCSFAHGTRAIRTHLDSAGPQAAISWPVFEELRKEWAGRIELQAVSLVPLQVFGGPEGEALAARVAAANGVLGAVGYVSPEIDALLDRMLALAAAHGLDLDLHCCSLAVQAPQVVAETLDLVVEAGISVISLPMCNLYLQDRAPGRTPRWRGVTLLHELAARRVRVAVASDNCRDAFHGYGDHDMLEVFREAARIAHLDRPFGEWPRAVTATPADLMGLAGAGRIGPGLPADLVLFEGRAWSELLSRPQSNRVVLRDGRPIERRLPDYRELDDLFSRREPQGVRHGA